MRIVFRVDASLTIGTGHVMRCLTLADSLKEEGGQCHFVMRNQSGHLGDTVEEKGHHIHLLPNIDAEASSSYDSRNTAAPHAGGLVVGWDREMKETKTALKKL